MNNLQLALGPLILLGWLAWWLLRFAALAVLAMADTLGMLLRGIGAVLSTVSHPHANRLARDLFFDSASSAPSAVQKSQIENRKS